MTQPRDSKGRFSSYNDGRKHTKRAVKKISNVIHGGPAQTKTFIAFLVDDSGSMGGFSKDVPLVYDALVKTLKQSGLPEASCAVYSFGDIFRVVVPVTPIALLTEGIMASYAPQRPATALYDAIGQAISDLDILDDGSCSFLLQILTDGEENSSLRFSQFQIANWIQTKRNSDRWTFAVSCPERFRASIENTLEIPAGCIQGWDTNSQASFLKQAGNTVTATASYTQSRAAGARSVSNFYATINVGKKSIADVIKDLDVISATRFQRIKVTKLTKTKDLMEGKNKIYENGKIFYSLSKTEKVQGYKEIVLQRRGEPTLYGGSKVRNVLGIPQGQDGRVVPGNLGEWIIWVQSTAPNRNLLGGTEVLYDKNLVAAHVRPTWLSAPV